MTISLLTAYGIPCFKYYDKEGGAGKVINGFSGFGVGLYVPASMAEDAQNPAGLHAHAQRGRRETLKGASIMSYMQEYEKWLASPALSEQEHAELESIRDEKEIRAGSMARWNSVPPVCVAP